MRFYFYSLLLTQPPKIRKQQQTLDPLTPLPKVSASRNTYLLKGCDAILYDNLNDTKGWTPKRRLIRAKRGKNVKIRLCAERGKKVKSLLRAKRGENFQISLCAKRGENVKILLRTKRGEFSKDCLQL